MKTSSSKTAPSRAVNMGGSHGIGAGKQIASRGDAGVNAIGSVHSITIHKSKGRTWAEVTATSTGADMVNTPPHYTTGNIEFIEAVQSALGTEGFIHFLRGQVIKYSWRMARKGSLLQDAEKCQWYQNKLVQTLREQVNVNPS